MGRVTSLSCCSPLHELLSCRCGSRRTAGVEARTQGRCMHLCPSVGRERKSAAGRRKLESRAARAGFAITIITLSSPPPSVMTAPPPPGPPPSKPGGAPTSQVVKENPYLAHLPPSERYTNGSTSSSSSHADPLAGFVPRRVLGPQVRKVLEGDMNPFSAPSPRPYSQRYRDILAKRKSLPVYAQMDEFYEKFNESQIMVMIGETGSGKTTQ